MTKDYTSVPEDIITALKSEKPQVFSYKATYAFKKDTGLSEEEEIKPLDLDFMRKRASIWNPFAEKAGFRTIGSVVAEFGRGSGYDSSNDVDVIWHSLIIDVIILEPEEQQQGESSFSYIILPLDNIADWKTFGKTGKMQFVDRFGKECSTRYLGAWPADYENFNTITASLEDFAEAMEREFREVKEMLKGKYLFVNRAKATPPGFDYSRNDNQWITGEIVSVKQNKTNPFYTVKLGKTLWLYEDKRKNSVSERCWSLAKDKEIEVTMFIDTKRRIIFHEWGNYYLDFRILNTKEEKTLVRDFIKTSYKMVNSTGSVPHFEYEWLPYKTVTVPTFIPSQIFENNRKRYISFLENKQLYDEKNIVFKKIRQVSTVGKRYKVMVFDDSSFIVYKLMTKSGASFSTPLKQRMDAETGTLSGFFGFLTDSKKKCLNTIGRTFVDLGTFSPDEIMSNAASDF